MIVAHHFDLPLLLGRRTQSWRFNAPINGQRFPPLPRGEGRGEGEEIVRQPAAPEQDTPAKRRAQFEERQLRELAHGRPLVIEWFLASQFLLEKRPAEARPLLEKIAAAEAIDNDFSQRIAGALVELGEMDAARQLLESALDNDPENALVHAQLAGVHFRARRFDEAIAAAVESLSLLYFQPGLHALLGQALIETKRFDEAERELLVAVSQSPRHIAAHELLAKLYRDHLTRPADAFAHEGRARSLRNEISIRSQTENPNGIPPFSTGLRERQVQLGPSYPGSQPAESTPTLIGLRHTNTFGPDIDPTQIITIVSGLPRSGTSLMMQLLVAAGREALTDSKRAADEDNPLGYFEFEKSIELARDTSWLPQARGKVVKIVAQLLSHLPANEHYQIIFIERDLAEVIASQKAMLARHGRRGAELDERRLRDTYTSQLNRIEAQLARRPDARVLNVNHADLIAEPMTEVNAIAAFLGAPFDCRAAADVVRPELHRQKFAAEPMG